MKRRSLCFSFLFLGLVQCLIHDLVIKEDDRQRFFIENFGFDVGGEFHMNVSGFKVGESTPTEAETGRIAFLVRKTDTDTAAFAEQNVEDIANSCQFDSDSIRINITTSGEGFASFKINDEEEAGFYNTYFISCLTQPISFELKLTQFNVDANGAKNYLSIGYSPLPTIFAVFTGVYFLAVIFWVFNFVRANGATVNRIHHLMSAVLVLKILSLLFKTLDYHFIKTTGIPTGWSIAYYIFTALKGIFFFVVIAMIGTGWSFIKPFLSDKDKRIFMIVIPLQLLDNIALIIIEETAPGSQRWETWKDIFRLVDIICCGAILIPIIWSIKHLREAAEIDGKAARNMKKLKLFRQFYLMVVSYIYFTRIIVYLVDAALPFRWVWFGDFSSELATLAFFVFTGYKFRPTSDNPYFSLAPESEEELKDLQRELELDVRTGEDGGRSMKD